MLERGLLRNQSVMFGRYLVGIHIAGLAAQRQRAQRTCGRRDRGAAAFLHLLGQLLDRQRDDLIQLCDI